MSRKQDLRRECLKRRREKSNRLSNSERICQALLALPEWQTSERVLMYVGVRSEVDTRIALLRAWSSGKCVAVPFCDGDRLQACHVTGDAELSLGAFEIPEPRLELRAAAAKRCWQPAEVDLVVVPGIAFDLTGNRLGHGQGYYDRLLATLRPDAWRVGLAFECQLLPSLPAEPHDQRVQTVITEQRVHRITG